MAYLSFYVPKILHEKKSGDTGLDTILISYKYELSEGSSIQVSSEYTNLIGTGNGNKYLSNDGTYKEIQVPSISPIVIDINDTEKVYTSEEITEIYQAHKSGRDIYLKFGSEPELRLVNAVASIGDSVILFASYITSMVFKLLREVLFLFKRIFLPCLNLEQVIDFYRMMVLIRK